MYQRPILSVFLLLLVSCASHRVDSPDQGKPTVRPPRVHEYLVYCDATVAPYGGIPNKPVHGGYPAIPAHLVDKALLDQLSARLWTTALRVMARSRSQAMDMYLNHVRNWNEWRYVDSNGNASELAAYRNGSRPSNGYWKIDTGRQQYLQGVRPGTETLSDLKQSIGYAARGANDCYQLLAPLYTIEDPFKSTGQD